MRTTTPVLAALLVIAACSETKRCPEPEECPRCPSSSAAPSASAAVNSATASATSSGLALDLPRPAGGDATAELLMVEISPRGELTIDGRAVRDTAELEERVHAAAARDPGVRATVRADRETSYARVMDVVDAIKRAGVNRIAFGVPAKASASALPSSAGPATDR